MKPGRLGILILIAGIAVLAAFFPRALKPVSTPDSTATKLPENSDLTIIRTFTANPNLEVTYVNTGLPTPYFRVGKVTKAGNVENMDPIDGWRRTVNVYDTKDLIDGKCSVYEYHTDTRNHTLTAVIIRGLKPGEIEARAKSGAPCTPESGNIPKISRDEAETVAMSYLSRTLPDFARIKNLLKYSQQQNGESHEWLWEDKEYKLPEDLSSRPYPGPIIRISIYGNNEIQYWNTTSLF